MTDSLDRWTLLAHPEKLKLAEVYRLFVFDSTRSALLARHVENAVELGLDQTLSAYFDGETAQGDEVKTMSAQ